MVKGLDIFKEYFREYSNQYVLIGGAACDIFFSNNNIKFRVTRDLDIVLIVDALTAEFGEKMWEFIQEGKYRIRQAANNKTNFYRFDKPENEDFPKMIELFCKDNYSLKHNNGLTPIHIDDEVSSLSAILLDRDYYSMLELGKVIVDDLSVLRPEYLVLFKAKAFLDMKRKKEKGENIDSNDIKKHKRDVFRISVELMLEKIGNLPASIEIDIKDFISSIKSEPYDDNTLKMYGINNNDVISLLEKTFLL